MTAASWIHADWPAPQGVVAGCSTRIGGVSRGRYASLNLGEHVGDDETAVARNRGLLATLLDLPGEPLWLSQVHGCSVEVNARPGAEADASVAGDAGAVCAIMVADCLPVLFCSENGSEIAAAHAGWRGLAAGVLENTLAALAAPPSAILAWLGPAISQPAFEVGDEVRDAFVSHEPTATAHFEPNPRGRWQADLYGLARQRLAAAGVERVYGGGFCTSADSERFFSHRRDGTSGRMAALIFRR